MITVGHRENNRLVMNVRDALKNKISWYLMVLTLTLTRFEVQPKKSIYLNY